MLDAATFTPLHATERESGRPRGAGLPSGCRPAWCVAATYPKAERRAHAALHLKGYDPWLPLITIRWRDRTWHTRPAFPGYVFLRLDLSRPWYPIRHAPGVFQLLMTDSHPAICPDHAVEALQSALHAAEPFSAPKPPWKPGTPCSVVLGPMAGLPAVVLSVHDNEALVSLMFLGHLREIHVSTDALEPRDDF
jgi:transcriptional antiterminator RfaH